MKSDQGLFQLTSPLLIWIGMVLAICMEAVVKFRAPSVTLEIGLDVGRQVFPALTVAEWILVGICLLAFAFSARQRSHPIVVTSFLFALVVLVLQTAWLLPELMHQATLIIAQQGAPASHAHQWYVVLTVLKLAGLLTAAHYSFLRSGNSIALNPKVLIG